MAVQGSPAVARHRLRLALRRTREATGRTQGDIAKSLDWSLSKLQRIEARENYISTTDLRALLGQLKITDPGLISTLVSEAKVARARSRWDEPRYRDNLTPAMRLFLQYETEATAVRSYQTTIIPGLLQTPEFAAEVFRGFPHLTDREREVRLEVRMGRAAAVFDRMSPPTYMLLLDDVLLRRDFASRATLVGQLQRLLEYARSGRIDLRIASSTAVIREGAQSPFTLLTIDDEGDSILYREFAEYDALYHDSERIKRYSGVFTSLWDRSHGEHDSERMIRDRISDLSS
jgi:transcriptional regulator with XRE-family HTH domain